MKNQTSVRNGRRDSEEKKRNMRNGQGGGPGGVEGGGPGGGQGGGPGGGQGGGPGGGQGHR